MKEKRLMVSLV